MSTQKVIELIAGAVAGFGLFIFGLRMIGESLRSVTGRRLRRFVSEWSKWIWFTPVTGMSLGALTQSSASTAFVITGTVSAQLLSLEAAMKVVIWSEIGTSVLLLLASVKLKIAILVILGLSGIFYRFGSKLMRQKVIQLLLGISLLLFGFTMLKECTISISETEFIQRFLNSAAMWLPAVFLYGVGARVLIQSSAATALLAIPMLAEPNLFTIEQTAMFIYGSSIGSAISTYFLAVDMRGTSRQLPWFKITEDIVAALVLVLLFIPELFGAPLLVNTLGAAGIPAGEKVLILYLVSRLIPILIILPFEHRLADFLRKKLPPTPEERLAIPKYIHEEMLGNPAGVIELLGQEEARVIHHFPEYIQPYIGESRPPSNDPNLVIHQALQLLLKEFRVMVHELDRLATDEKTVAQLSAVGQRLQVITAINDDLYELTDTLHQLRGISEWPKALQMSVGGLEKLMETMYKTASEGDTRMLDILKMMVADHLPLVNESSREYVTQVRETGHPETIFAIVRISELVQRCVWRVEQWIVLYNPEDEG